ncbi:MAG: PAS domain-containing sensor histidine kinase [Gammaproteobacteria bacterium]|nr:PAS domain-containing sensor histidine kinase [Gammaproteobacteria bacterium]NIO61659.1 PAS domain-containing sensor histidine kinase [Gammaproteobacteria bacterium]NIP49212.1 PAS domain-containing sensor histidine kinase [Gammaproteobacteria bacterium]NIQ10076.1 PAS domain-containing sensor histidine kinase [Gammaproteobacteria bacterium]NIQ18910.1 PAS domain-containing sensor histidine kinase [Gammaproteobacteria bacterium]
MSISAKTALQLFDNLTTAILLFDKRLNLVWINSAGENLLAASRKRLMGLKPEQVLPSPPDLVEMIHRSRETGAVYSKRALEIATHNAHAVLADCRVTPLLAGHKCKEVIVELVDANTIQRILREENITLQHDAARQSLRGMAHEIKNPLGGIRGAAQLLESELNKGQSELNEYTRIIIQEADRLRNFIDRMLAGDQQQEYELVNIHELLEYVCQIVEAEYEGEFRIARDYDPSLPNIEVDREKVIQAILNVTRNAVQVIDRSSGFIQLKTRILRMVMLHKVVHRHVIQVDIIDDGPGIPPDIEKSIFYPLITGRPEGTGLGLSIAQSLISAHGGLIEYERKDDLTIFSIYIPTERNNGT